MYALANSLGVLLFLTSAIFARGDWEEGREKLSGGGGEVAESQLGSFRAHLCFPESS